MPAGCTPTGMRAVTVYGGLDHRQVVRGRVGDVEAGAVRQYGKAQGRVPHIDGARDLACAGADHRDVVRPHVGHVSCRPSSEILTLLGSSPTAMVSTTILVRASITDTVSVREFVTYTCEPSGVTATLSGLSPTRTLSTTASVRMSITESVSEWRFVTYTKAPGRAEGFGARPATAPGALAIAASATGSA